MKYPDEFALLSLFECEPTMLDKDVPFFYNSSRYRYQNENKESCEVSMLPSYGEVTLKVGKESCEIAYLKLQNIEELIILSDSKFEKKIMLTTPRYVFKIQIKPWFKIEYTDEMV